VAPFSYKNLRRWTEKHDLDETVVEEWVEEKAPFERAHEVIREVYYLISAAEIADRPCVSHPML